MQFRIKDLFWLVTLAALICRFLPSEIPFGKLDIARFALLYLVSGCLVFLWFAMKSGAVKRDRSNFDGQAARSKGAVNARDSAGEPR